MKNPASWPERGASLAIGRRSGRAGSPPSDMAGGNGHRRERAQGAHGVITSDTKVVISGLSSLTLSDLRIVAPEIELRSDRHISLGSGVSLEVGPAQTDSSGVVTGGSVLITSGGHGTPTVYAAAGATLSAGGAAAGTLVVGSSGGLTILSSQQVVSGSGGTITGGPDDGSATSQEDPAPAESGGGALGAGASLALLLGIACLVCSDRRGMPRA